MTDSAFLQDAYVRLRAAVADHGQDTLPPPATLAQAETAILAGGHQDTTYLQGRGADATLRHLLDTVVPALNGQALSGRYYGFVTGGVLPVAEAADNMVSALDQNVHGPLPNHSVCAAVEHAALQMVIDVLGLGRGSGSEHEDQGSCDWPGRLLTTGATASNVLGLAQGREAVLSMRTRRQQQPTDGSAPSVAELGLLQACRRAGVRDIRVLTSLGHSSLYKAASLVGLGRAAVVELPLSEAEPWRLDLDAVEQRLAEGAAAHDDGGIAHIIVVSAGEVNTGRFATTGLADMQRLRRLADTYDAWLHVDGAFGLFARALPQTPEFARLHQHTQGLELADSITSDAHKLLNVPYDAGLFLSRDRRLQTSVFHNPNAAYLTMAMAPAAPASSAASSAGPLIGSPMNMGIENSRRFRALPVYAVLLSEGRDGLATLQARMVRMARAVRRLILSMPEYECLVGADDDGEAETHIIVLFRARDPIRNEQLPARINASRQMYVSPTSWQGRPACRIAVSSWRADETRDLAVVKDVLERAARE